MDFVDLRVPTKQIRDFSTLISVMSQDLALQQGVSRLQTTSANLWTFLINIPSLLRIHFPLLNPTELHHYRVTCIIFLPRIKFWSNSGSSFSSSLSLAFVLYTFNASLLQALAVGKHLNKGIELNY
jgi:hypothetical protein